MSAPSVIVSEQCSSCKRTTPHLHYSSNHDTAVLSSLFLILLAEGLSFVSGAVNGSIKLYLAPDQIYAYTEVNRRIAEAMAPFQGVYYLGMGIELLTVLLLIMGAATLHSTTTQVLHRVTVYGAVVAFLVSRAALTLYYVKRTQVISALGIDPDLLRTANHVQSRFAAEAGFFGSSAFYILSILLPLILLFLLAFAAWELYTKKIVSVWQPTSMDVSLPPPPAPEPARPVIETGSVVPTIASTKPTKFCRFCGAKIVRDSKFCEECGMNLG